nr:hypothetical protein [Tanacetum cinerariifolium]
AKSPRSLSIEDDDLSQPWVCEETDPFTPRIRYFDLPKRTRMPSHFKTYDGSEDPEDHLKIFQVVAKVKRWAMPTWCHMFNSTLTGSARREGESMEDFVRRFKVERRDVKGAPEIMRISGFMHGITNPELIKRLHDKILKLVDEMMMMMITTSLLKGEVAVGDEEHSTSAWMSFVVVRSSSSYNGIIDRPRVRKIQAVPSTAHGMIKFPVAGGVLTLRSSKIIPIECEAVSGPEGQPPNAHQAIEERIKPADMTGVPRHIVEHRLNIRKGCPPVRQKRRSQAADRNQAIQEEVEKLVDAGIMKEVHYHIWLSNLVMVKKHDDSWRMCVDFKDLNKACPKDDKEKTAFITSQGVFCYSKMPFGLRNVGAIYQRLVDKAFHKQIGRNLEVYVDDLVIKSRTGDEIIRDIEETFRTLREINMKLNLKKCTFGFLAKSAEKSLPFFKTLKKCTKKSDFHWTEKAETAFKQMKQLIAELTTLTAPEEKEELIVYLAAVKEVGQILADFIVERPEEDDPDTAMDVKEELQELNIVHLRPKVQFEATNNEAEYEALIAGLRITEEMDVKNLHANVDSRLVANQVNRTYKPKEADMIRYLEKVRTLISSFKTFSIKQVPRSENKKSDALSKIASTSFAHMSKQVLAEELKEKSINELEVLTVVEEEGNTWMTPIYVYLTEETLSAEVNKARAVRLIPAEIDMPTLRTAEVDMMQNNEALGINLDLLEERREQAAIREAKSKAKMKKYYNSNVCSTSFKPGDLVYRSNDASRTKEVGKLSPK